jgi:hypothetical protein
MTAAEELVLIDAAISTILSSAAQSIGARERQISFLQLKDLWKRKDALEQVADATENGGLGVVQYEDRV